MSKKVNPTAVGLFVTGAIVLLMAGLFVLGSSEYFETKRKFVIYFRSSANGLSDKSDVQLGGVKVGSVTKMLVQFDPENGEKLIPVVIELSADRIAALTAEARDKDEILSEESIKSAVERGLRARLKSKSALTGQLYVDLEFLPEDETEYVFPGRTWDDLTQIPSVKGQIEQVLEKLAESLKDIGEADIGGLIKNIDDLVVNLDRKISDFDIKGISDSANNTLANIDKAVGEADIKGFFDKLKTTVDNIDSAVANIDEAVTEGDLKGVVANLKDGTADLKELIANIDEGGFNEAVSNASSAIEKIGAAGDNIARLADPEGIIPVQLNRTLGDLNSAARSLRELADFLKRNPNAIITGKRNP